MPPSKSHTLRAILFASLSDGDSTIVHPLQSPDTQAMIAACRQLGAVIRVEGDTLRIRGVSGLPSVPADILDAGNSGQVLRFVSAVAALAGGYVVMTGDHSIRSQRPMQPLISALNQLGVWCHSTRDNGYAPIILRGPMQPGTAVFCGKDSQPVSAMLIAAAFAKGPISLHITDPGEKAWVALTLSWFDRLGIAYTEKDYTSYCMFGNARIAGFDYTVPGDFSAAAYPIAAALITGSAICLQNLDMQDIQGDKAFIDVCRRMGAIIRIDSINNKIFVEAQKSPLQGLVIDVNDFIDAVPILAVLAAYAEGVTELRNAAVARQKECNRLACIVQELGKMGAQISETEDGLYIVGSQLHGVADLYAHQDHRMVLSLAVAALGATGISCIEGVSCIQKSYPTFLEDLQSLGGRISLCNP